VFPRSRPAPRRRAYAGAYAYPAPGQSLPRSGAGDSRRRVDGRHRAGGAAHPTCIGDLRALAESVEAVGLLHLVVVTPQGRLIAGRRRLEAVKLLGWRTATACCTASNVGCHLCRASFRRNFHNRSITRARSRATASRSPARAARRASLVWLLSGRCLWTRTCRSYGTPTWRQNRYGLLARHSFAATSLHLKLREVAAKECLPRPPSAAGESCPLTS
jgi:hypothetical protein